MTSTLNEHQNTFSIQIIENEDLSGHSDDEGSNAAEVFDAVSGNGSSNSSSNSSSLAGRLALMGRRGSLQGPEAPRAFVQGRRHSTGQVLTFRWATKTQRKAQCISKHENISNSNITIHKAPPFTAVVNGFLVKKKEKEKSWFATYVDPADTIVRCAAVQKLLRELIKNSLTIVNKWWIFVFQQQPGEE